MTRFPLLLVIVVLTGCSSTKIVREIRTTTRSVTTTATVTVTITTKVNATAEPLVYVETCCRPVLEYKPEHMSYYGGHQYIRHIRWTTYGGPKAFGRGEWGQNDCNPSCADGHYTFTPVTIKLETREFCQGATAYRDWTITGIDLGPGEYWPRSISDQGCT
jgi:hypothetical protein